MIDSGSNLQIANLNSLASKAYLAAICGQLDRALALIGEIRSDLRFSDASALIAEVMLIEGVIAVYRGEIEYAKNRLERVVAFGDQYPLIELAALARGWLALIAYNDGAVVDAARLIARGLSVDRGLSARTRLRVSTIMSLLCAYVGRDKAATEWLLGARIAASEVGFDGALSSVAFDLAVAALDRCCLDRLQGKLDTQSAQDALIRVVSAKGYDLGSGSALQQSLHALALGMALNLNGRFAEARREIQGFIDAKPSSRLGDSVCAKVELAVALLGCGESLIDAGLEEELRAGVSLLSDPVEKGTLIAVLIENDVRKGMVDRAEEMKDLLERQIVLRKNLELDLCEVLIRSNLMTAPEDWLHAATPGADKGG